MNKGSYTDNSSFDMKTILSAFWTYKYVVFFFTCLSVIIGGFYTINTEKIYKSDAYFTLGKNETNIQENNFGALIGKSIVDPSMKTMEKISYRIFIERVDRNFDLLNDTYFNSYNINISEPKWKKILKKRIGYVSPDFNKTEMAWKQIIYNYKKNISMDTTPADNLKVSVSHKSPERAAQIANGIMTMVIDDNKVLSLKTQQKKTTLITNDIAAALLEYEQVNQELIEFELNNLDTDELFELSAENLSRLKLLLQRTNTLIEAFNKISELLVTNDATQKNYLLLRKKYPIIDDVEFRRILGQNEIMTEWIWPNNKIVSSVLFTLDERKGRLKSEITEQSIKTEALSEKVKYHDDIKRRLAIAMTNYQARLDFFRAADINSILKPELSEVFEYAEIPIHPISPKRNLILALSAAIGIILGLFAALFINSFRGVILTNGNLIEECAADTSVSAKSLKSLRKKNILKLNKLKNTKTIPIIRELIIEINKKNNNFVVISGLKSSIKGKDLARILSCFISNNKYSIAVLNFSSLPTRKNMPINKYKNNKFDIINKTENITELRPNISNHSINFFMDNDLANNISSIEKDFDLIIMSAENQDSVSLTRAMSQYNIFHIGLVRRNSTKLVDLRKIKDKSPFEAIVYG